MPVRQGSTNRATKGTKGNATLIYPRATAPTGLGTQVKFSSSWRQLQNYKVKSGHKKFADSFQLVAKLCREIKVSLRPYFQRNFIIKLISIKRIPFESSVHTEHECWQSGGGRESAARVFFADDEKQAPCLKCSHRTNTKLNYLSSFTSSTILCTMRASIDSRRRAIATGGFFHSWLTQRGSMNKRRFRTTYRVLPLK